MEEHKSEFVLRNLKQFVPALIAKSYINEISLEEQNDGYRDYDSSYLCDFVNSLIFTLVSCTNNKNNNNNLFINTDDLLLDFDFLTKQSKAKNKEKFKATEATLVHDFINYMSEIPNFVVNVLYISNEYTPNDDLFMKNVNSIEDYYKKSTSANGSLEADELPVYQICLILPKFDADVITETSMQNRCAMKINYLLNRIQQLNATSQYREAKKQTIGVVFSSMELLNKNVFLTKKFWLSCPSKNLMAFLSSSNSVDSSVFLHYMKYMFVKWNEYKKGFAQNSTFAFNHNLKQYILDIVVHLRMHRFSVQGRSGGISSISLNDMMQLSILMAISYDLLIKVNEGDGDDSMSGINGFGNSNHDILITPDTIKVAARWYFPFKLQLTYKNTKNKKTRNFRKDYSVQYGSDQEIVDELISSLDDLSLQRQNDLQSREQYYPFFVELLVVDEVLKNVVSPL